MKFISPKSYLLRCLALVFITSATGCSDPKHNTTQSAVATKQPVSELERCQALKDIHLDGVDLDIESATYIEKFDDIKSQWLSSDTTTAFTPFCSVKGYFEKRKGVNNKDYAIGFGISLPKNWNGRFLFQGGGGLNGLVREPLGQWVSGEIPGLFKGYAVVTTDSGHQSNVRFDTDFFEDQKALLNFYSQAVVKTTGVTRSIVESYYGKQPQYAYFAGCSTGGREAMTMSQRYPELFNGIIVGAPARKTNYSELADLWSATTLRSVNENPKDPPFSEKQQEVIVDALVKQCDAKDGLADGLIMDVQGCDFDPAEIECKNNQQGDTCLSNHQVSALKKAFAGPKFPNGENVYPGFYYDTGIAAKAENGIPGLLHGAAAPLGQPRIDLPFDLERELSIARGFPLEPGNAVLTDLSTFAFTGRKLIFYHGVSDPWFSAKDTLGYFQAMTEANGGAEAVNRWSQFYFVPGMGHCSGGEKALDKFDMLTPLVNWVENGERPNSVVAQSSGLAGISRPLCPYPQVAHYKGPGDEKDADSFECR